ncbi:hypothetical protein FSP39_001257, partial [Pinctada imbricata]
DFHYNQLVDRKYAEVSEKLQSEEILSRQRANELHVLRSQFNNLLHMVIHSNKSLNFSIAETLPGPIANISEASSQSSLHLPSLFTYLPHLIGKPESLKPKFQLSKNRYGASIVMGIPTIKRDKISYLNPTIASLIKGMTEEERKQCLIVVFVAEVRFITTLSNVNMPKFPEYIQSGLLEVIAPSPDFYPNLDDIPQTYGDTKDRVKWRTKQNLDFSFLMLYARSRGMYYVQLEDDVIAKPGFFTIMKTFAEQQTSSRWILLEFSTLGFIGKMFKASDLPTVVEFFLMFHKDKPIDWLLDYLLSVKVCNPEKDSRHCGRMKAEVRRRYKPSLFQHVGMHSSLKGKVQKLKDKDFGKHMLHRAHVNPKAAIKTSLVPYQKFTLHKAYIGEDIFWATTPGAGDFINIRLTPPIFLEEILIRSGNPDHAEDIFQNTSVLIKPDPKFASSFLKFVKNGKIPFHPVDEGFFKVGEFDKQGLAQFSIPDTVGRIEHVKLLMNANNKNWVIISEVCILNVLTCIDNILYCNIQISFYIIHNFSLPLVQTCLLVRFWRNIYDFSTLNYAPLLLFHYTPKFTLEQIDIFQILSA